MIQAGGISDASLTRIGKIHGVTQTLALDGATVTSGGTKVNVIGVNAQQFRSWTPLKTASNQRLWTALDAGGFVASTDARHQLGLHKGDSYSFTGTGTVSLQFAGAAPLGIAGIDVVVSNKVSARLGLIHNVAALISAPGLSIKKLRHDVKTALAGSSASLITLRPQHAPPPVATSHVPSGRPTSYIQLFQESAAQYCPGLPWTVLAAIGQIESADGANTGPSTAGALGPMQFLPSTWAEWGITTPSASRAAEHHEPVRRGALRRPVPVRGRRRDRGGPARRDLRLQPRRLVRHRGPRARQGVPAGLRLTAAPAGAGQPWLDGSMPDYDAFLLVSFGGPEGPDDVMPFLENVTRGRGVPRDRLAEVAHHYDLFGGVSPINQQCRDLLTAIGKDFAAAGVDLPLYWGNRNWHPYLTGTVAQMAADGVRHAIAFVTSAYGSYSGCRQYLDDIEAARAQAGPGAPRIDKIRHFFNHPGFIGPVARGCPRGNRPAPGRRSG